ncbi:hypothetical protein, partial [Achromobacter spanius]|uniref:hypothetical protein n=1 Tax=Achromobacter spanius TaxID=217203 RepID=UPI003F69320C
RRNLLAQANPRCTHPTFRHTSRMGTIIPAHAANGHDHSGTRREWARSFRHTSRMGTIIPAHVANRHDHSGTSRMGTIIPAHVANGHDHSGIRREPARSFRHTSRAVTIISPQASDDSAQRPDFSVLKTIQRYL